MSELILGGKVACVDLGPFDPNRFMAAPQGTRGRKIGAVSVGDRHIFKASCLRCFSYTHAVRSCTNQRREHPFASITSYQPCGLWVRLFRASVRVS